jgi:hypothetical protein
MELPPAHSQRSESSDESLLRATDTAKRAQLHGTQGSADEIRPLRETDDRSSFQFGDDNLIPFLADAPACPG